MSELVNRMDENGSGQRTDQAKLAETVRCLFVWPLLGVILCNIFHSLYPTADRR